MTTNPKVSVIIPVHNTEKYIEECLNSVINQTLTDIEIICVDDASTDSSFNILDTYSKKDSRVKIYHHDVSKSALGARKTGVENAKGDYIMFLDSDDYYSLDACETAYNKIKEENVEILHFTLDVINCCDAPQKRVDALLEYVKPFEGRLDGKNVFSVCFEEGKYAHTPVNKIYKSELCKKSYKQIEDIHLVFAEDLYAYFIIADNAKSYYGWNSKPLYFYCYGRGVTTGNKQYSLQEFEKHCKHADTYFALERYVKTKNAAIYQKIAKKLYSEWIFRNIRTCEKNLLPAERTEGYALMNKYWGQKNVSKALVKLEWRKMKKSPINTFKFILKTMRS